MAGILGEYTEIFLEESEDQIEELNSNLLLLEKDHNNQEIINDIFRTAHSLKSSAAFVGLYHLSDLAHKMENLLQKIREGSLEVNVTLVNILFESFDLIKNVITSVSEGKKIDEPFTDMIERIQNYEENPSLEDSASTSPIPPGENGKSVNSPSKQDALVLTMDDVSEIHSELEDDPSLNPYKVKIVLKSDTQMKGLRFTLILQNLKNNGIVFKSKPSDMELESGGITSTNLYFVYLSSKREAEIHELANIDMVETVQVSHIKLPDPLNRLDRDSQKGIKSVEPVSSTDNGNLSPSRSRPQNSTETPGAESKVVLKSIKVSSDKLDHLLNNVGELVITNSGFQKIYDDLIIVFGEDTLFTELKSKIDQINRISKDLQTGIMNIRMVPIGSVFNRFSRLVRDLSLDTGKKVELVLKGENTELDKKVIDAIGEPMLHLIRNSMDHGIELPAERMKAGKPEEGKIELNAYQGGSNIMVEIRDDGKGLSRSKIADKVVQKGLATQDEVSAMSDNEVYQFIFAPGFSTAEKVTDISGRGVGMHVVNNLIQEFKGKIIINSQEGVGSSFTLSFPQALAIIPSILVVMEEEVYAFPLSEVSETIKVNIDQITTLEGHEIINLRGEVLPIYRLNRIIGLADREDLEELPVVIVNYKSRKLGFIVDDLIGKHETVIKSLAKNFKNVPGLTGATIMGDGTIILVLDIPGLVELASVELMDESASQVGEQMKRVSSIRSLENSESDYVFKTKLATNIFNSKLFLQRSKDKLKNKKDRGRTPSHSAELEDSRIIVSKSELIREDSLDSNQKEVLGSTRIPEAIEFANSESEPKEVKNTPTIDSTAGDKPEPKSVKKTEPSESLYSHLESKIGDVDEDHKKKASEIIKGFIDQKNERLNSVHQSSTQEIDELLNKEQLRKLESVMNTGMMNAAVVLSQLVGKEVELFVPDISLTNKEGLAKEIRFSDENFFGMKVRMNGDLHGNLLMMFSEENGKEIANQLLGGKNVFTSTSGLSEDSVSVLGEISNIVCSGVINSLSNRSKSEIMPSVPEFITGKFIEVLDIVKPERTKFLSMHTEFNHEGNNLLGILLFLPDFDELVGLISKL